MSMLSVSHWRDMYWNQVSMPSKIPPVLNSEQASAKYSANQTPRSKNDRTETATGRPAASPPGSRPRGTDWHAEVTSSL